MSTNQYRGREETDKIDFKNLTPEEQKIASKENISEEQNEETTNEKLAGKAKDNLDRQRAKNIH